MGARAGGWGGGGIEWQPGNERWVRVGVGGWVG